MWNELLRTWLELLCSILLGISTLPDQVPIIYETWTPSYADGGRSTESGVPSPQVRVIPVDVPSARTSGWTKDSEVSWYGPGFYGNRTACGLAYTKTILGVAHRTLPCGTLVVFRWKGREVTVPVIDRGPYVEGRTWDLSGGLCVYLEHCFTGPIEWRFK